MKKNALYIQSGGPTAVINCSAYGVIDECRKAGYGIGRLYASIHGIAGVLRDELYDCTELKENELEHLKKTPSMAFGSCRYIVREDSEEDYQKIVDTLKKYKIYYIFINGGNGSVSAGKRLYMYLKKADYKCRLIVIPKTVDNDIAVLDHAPGFPSAARHTVITISELVHDMYTYDTDLIMAVEVMGRNTGYLAAAAAAARITGWGPDLIYVPEVVFEPEKFVKDVAEVIEKKGKCFAVVAEGVKTADGKYLFEDTTVNKVENPSINMGGITPYLNMLLRRHFDCKIRCIDLGLMQRCAAHDASEIDRGEAEMLGREAVKCAFAGETGKMMTLTRLSSMPYKVRSEALELEKVADVERVMDIMYVNENHADIKDAYMEYILPLIGTLPEYIEIDSMESKGENYVQL